MYFRSENQAMGNGSKRGSLLNMKQNLWDKILPPMPPPDDPVRPETTTQMPENTTTTKEPEFRVNFQEYFMQIGNKEKSHVLIAPYENLQISEAGGSKRCALPRRPLFPCI